MQTYPVVAIKDWKAQAPHPMAPARFEWNLRKLIFNLNLVIDDWSIFFFF